MRAGGGVEWRRGIVRTSIVAINTILKIISNKSIASYYSI